MKSVVIRQPHYVIVRSGTDQVALVRDTTSRVVVLAGRQGIAGPAGSALIIGTAGESLSGHRMVTTNSSGEIIYASNLSSAHSGRVIGMTTGAAAMGATATVQTAGPITESSWAWTPGSLLWIGANGQVGGMPPVTGWVQAIGYAQTPTTIFLQLTQPFLR